MSATLPIHINSDGLHDIDVEKSFDADESFDVSLENHGAPIHVHLHLDDDLSEAASLSATNHYIEEGETELVPVTVHDGPGGGKLKVVTGYGAETSYVDIDIAEFDPDADEILVDETLSKPQPRSPQSTTEASELTRNLPLVALVVLALVLVLGVGILVDWGVALFGAVSVLIGIGVATYFLTQ